MRARLQVLAGQLREILDKRGPRTRRLLQRVLNGRRVACTRFRKPGRRGYRFAERDIPYGGLLSQRRWWPQREATVRGAS